MAIFMEWIRAKLYSINKTTGRATVIGSLGVNDGGSLAFSSNGTLYMLGIQAIIYIQLILKLDKLQ